MEMSYITHFMERTKPKPKKSSAPKLVRYSLMLTPATDAALKRLSKDASDYVGWKISSSAIVRALVRYAEQQPPGWATSQLFPLIEREIASGPVWGKRKPARPPRRSWAMKTVSHG